MFNQYILEAKYLDNINRVKRKNIVGVYASLEKIEEVKKILIVNGYIYVIMLIQLLYYHCIHNMILKI